MAQVVKSPDAFRTISEVSDALSLEPHVLRFWESKFDQVQPVKRSGGRRYYRANDVALLSGIKFLLRDQGMTIKGAQRLLREKGVRYVAALGPDADAEDGASAEVVSLAGRRDGRAIAAEDGDGLAALVSKAVRAEQAEAVAGEADDEEPEEAVEEPQEDGHPAPRRPAGPPIPLPAHLMEDVANDARLRLPPRRPRINPELVRQNRGAVRRHLAALRDLRARMDGQAAGRDG